MEEAATPARMLILASSSPRRQQLIGLLGLPFRSQPSRVDESTPAQWSPERTVRELAYRKAAAAWKQGQQDDRGESCIIIGSDTIVALDSQILGKPKDDEDAVRMLTMLSGARHSVYTGVCCIGVPDGKTAVDHRVTHVHMRKLTEEQIRRYVAKGESRDKAGAYGIQSLGGMLVDRIDGCYFNVVGLPLSLLATQLEAFGITVP